MRFSEIDELVPDQLDFVPRERRNQMSLLVIAFVTTMAVIFIAAYAPVIRDMNLYTPIITIVAIAALCLYVVYSKQLNLDLVMSTEYQNLMFAQAVRVGCDFCMFVRRDGTIIYASDGMNSVFPSYDYAEAQALDGVFELAAVRQVDRERILGAIRSNSNDNLIFPIPAAAGGNKNYVLTVEPLPQIVHLAPLVGVDIGHARNLDRQQDDTFVEHLVVLQIVQQRVRHPVGRGRHEDRGPRHA